VEKIAMPATDDLTAIRQLLDVPHPSDAVTAAGRARLDELIHPADNRRRPGRTTHRATATWGRRIGIVATAVSVAAAATTLALAHQRKVYDYQFLPGTPANMAALTLTVPSGYTKASS